MTPVSGEYWGTYFPITKKCNNQENKNLKSG